MGSPIPVIRDSRFNSQETTDGSIDDSSDPSQRTLDSLDYPSQDEDPDHELISL